MRFEVFTAADMYTAVLWVMTPFSQVGKYKFSEWTRVYPEDGGSRFLRNADTYVPDSMNKHSRQP
jgi:hypothetical protein